MKPLCLTRISDLNKNELSKLFLRFCRETACGMNYLAEKKFVHRDLAARNVLLADDLTCKVQHSILIATSSDLLYNVFDFYVLFCRLGTLVWLGIYLTKS